MNTPICDFVSDYLKSKAIRMHMPGHKGLSSLGFEALDITEINGADTLYNSTGIIKESQENASLIFGTEKTLYSAEGSSLSIRAIIYLIKLYSERISKIPLILAARNAHKSFVTSTAILDVDVKWLFSNDGALLSYNLDLTSLEKALISEKPTALYLTSPDYLGNVIDIASVSNLCKKYGVILAVDNAHGAYLKFLPKSLHPIDLGADICCDSAHKTLPVITGGGYLHISKTAPALFAEEAEYAMSLFSSTSPSYLILQSLDKANAVISEKSYRDKLENTANIILQLKNKLIKHGFSVVGNEPLKLTVAPKSFGYLGSSLAKLLEEKNVIAEFSDDDFLVLMPSSNNKLSDIKKLEKIFLSFEKKSSINSLPPRIENALSYMSPHDAVFAKKEKTSIKNSEGKVLASLSVSCPPAVPIAICGEVITSSVIKCLEYYSIDSLYTVVSD